MVVSNDRKPTHMHKLYVYTCKSRAQNGMIVNAFYSVVLNIRVSFLYISFYESLPEIIQEGPSGIDIS